MNKKLLKYFDQYEEYHWWFVGRRVLLERIFKKYIAGRKKIKILDIGCGTGGNLEFLSRFGEVHGIDKSKSAIAYCTNKGFTNVRLADASKLPFGDSSFDVVSLLDVLEHIDKDEAVFKEVKRILKPGGKILVTVPVLPFIWSRHDALQGHFRRYSFNRIKDIAIRLNLKILTHTYFNFFLSAPIITIRYISKFRPFYKLGDYDNKINFDIAKINSLNKLLLSIFLLEVRLSSIIRYPFGISLLTILKK